MARPRYDDKFRANAVVLLEAAGYPETKGALERTAKHLSIPPRTLSRWALSEQNPPPGEMVTEKRAELSELLTKEINAALKEMNNARGGASYRDLGTVVGILVDKRQLLNDRPTENNTTRIIIEYEDAEIAPAQIASSPTESFG